MSIVRFPGDSRPRSSHDGALLLKPKQGFGSLHPSLHELYSLARRLGLSDLGTYNPSARLPGGGRSDHAYSPAWAFDVGVTKTGTLARLRYLFRQAIGRDEVEYVILEGVSIPRIWSRSRGGPRPYSGPATSPHVHVSGRRPGR